MTLRLGRAVGSFLLIAPTVLAAQGASRPKLFAINVLIGGSTAAVTAAIHHRPVTRAFLAGSAGGALVFTGKCLVAKDKPPAEWFGNQVTMFGSSVTSNAIVGRRPLDRIVLGLGPILFYHDKQSPHNGVKLDLLQVGVTAYYVMNAGASIDWNASATHGSLILYDAGSPTYEVAGIIKTGDRHGFQLNHEQIHVAQEQFVTIALEEPLQSWLLQPAPGGKVINRYFNIGLLAPVWAAANALTSRESRPWEKEAKAFAARC
jgi:hypothetical protein